jgi:hypothetical protein
MLPKKEQPKFDGLKIIGLDSTKNMTEQRPAMENNIIPKHPSINMVLGSIGSGKTVMCCNMILNPYMYGKDKTGRPYYDEVFLFTNSSDDIMQKLIDDGVIPKDHVKHHPEEKHLKAVIKKQKEKVKEANNDHLAKNKSGSSAFGIGQILKETSADPMFQILHTYKYIQHRYKTPCSAQRWHNRHNWY